VVVLVRFRFGWRAPEPRLLRFASANKKRGLREAPGRPTEGRRGLRGGLRAPRGPGQKTKNDTLCRALFGKAWVWLYGVYVLDRVWFQIGFLVSDCCFWFETGSD
jgi:hypothetical protein